MQKDNIIPKVDHWQDKNKRESIHFFIIIICLLIISDANQVK